MFSYPQELINLIMLVAAAQFNYSVFEVLISSLRLFNDGRPGFHVTVCRVSLHIASTPDHSWHLGKFELLDYIASGNHGREKLENPFTSIIHDRSLCFYEIDRLLSL